MYDRTPNVFISHSSRDRWVAKRINEDLQNLGASTFLDEKHIESGASIDLAIRGHLSDCDDFLLLVSPISVRSEWVLLELGGALALEKNVIPILLYVGVNDLPKAVSLRLARDISDIAQYYDELRSRFGIIKPSRSLRPKTAKTRAIRIPQSKYSIGDRVVTVPIAPDANDLEAQAFGWNAAMERYLGQTTYVRDIVPLKGVSEPFGYLLQIDDGKFAWAGEWLLAVTPRVRRS
jgi:hypothetical protein